MPDLRPAKRDENKDLTTLERIRLSYKKDGDIILTPKEEEIKDRWFLIYTSLCQFKSSFEVIEMLQKDLGLSRAQAFRDLDNAQRLYGNVASSSKEGERRVFYEMGLTALRDAYKEKDWDAYAKIYAQLVKVKGFDKEDPNLPEWDALQPHVYNFTTNPQDIGLPVIDNIDEVIAYLSKKKSRKMLDDIQDADIVQ
jgi:hypothetical protein